MTIQENIPLSQFTTFGVGGSAQYFVEVSDEKELEEAVMWAKSKNLPLFILGGGSNIVVSNEGFEGLVIRPNNTSFTTVDSGEDVLVTASAGMNWDKLVEATVEQDLQGIECLSGIPGTVGGGAVQNIGAYGQEIKDTLIELRAFEVTSNTIKTFSNEECQFEYRESIFKKAENQGKYIVLSVTLKLHKNAAPTLTYESLKNYLETHNISPTLKTVSETVLKLREQNHISPDIAGNAGSFFKNPVITELDLKRLQSEYPDIKFFPYKSYYKIAAGWLIDKAGWKGKVVGNVQVSPKHALVITNPQKKADASEIKNLADAIQKDIFDKFGITLEREVHYIGNL